MSSFQYEYIDEPGPDTNRSERHCGSTGHVLRTASVTSSTRAKRFAAQTDPEPRRNLDHDIRPHIFDQHFLKIKISLREFPPRPSGPIGLAIGRC
jgi:hypothetical protein